MQQCEWDWKQQDSLKYGPGVEWQNARRKEKSRHMIKISKNYSAIVSAGQNNGVAQGFFNKDGLTQFVPRGMIVIP